MAEREQRRRVDRTARVPAGQPRAQVRGRLRRPPSRASRPAAGRWAPPGRTARPAIAPPPSSPGKNACTTAASSPGHRADRVGAPGDQHQHDRRARATSTRSRSSCTPGSRRSATSQPSPEVPRPNRPASSPSTATTTSASRRVRGGVREPGAVRVADRAARGVGDRRAGQFGPQRGEDGGGRGSLGGFRVPAAEVAGHAVAPEEGQRVVGQRPDHGDAGLRAQRQDGVAVGQQHDGFLGQPPGQRAVPRRVQVDDLTVRALGR